MTGQGYICALRNLSPIEEADRILKAEFAGETVVVGNYYKEGDLGIMFDCETQLSDDFSRVNNLYRHSDKNENKEVKGYFEDNRRVRPIRLKGVKVSAFWVPLSYLESLGDTTTLKVGDQITSFEGTEICSKYIPKKNPRQGAKEEKAKINIAPTFKEHFDTDQLFRNMGSFKAGDRVTFTEKLHGTSCRVGHLSVIQPLDNWIVRIFYFFACLFNGLSWKESIEAINTPISIYSEVVGSRRVLKSVDGVEARGNSYYAHDIYTESAEAFKEKLHKGETVYYEIVGYLPEGTPIMGGHSNEKLKKFMSKEEYSRFISEYGETTVFNYGCEVGKFDIYVYRITMTNEDGFSIDYPWDRVVERCEQLGVKSVPTLAEITLEEKDGILMVEDISFEDYCQEITDATSSVFTTHLKEGICTRVEGFTPKILKHKNFNFKVLEGIIKDSGIEDIEEIEQNA